MKRLLLALLIASVLGLALAACVSVPAEQPLIQERAATGSITAVNITASGTVTGGGLASTGFLKLAPGTSITVTSSGITPTASYQPIVAAAFTATSNIASKPAGTLLRLVNTGTPTITLTDTGTLLLSANIVLGQYDSLLLMSDGTNWIQMGTSDN